MITSKVKNICIIGFGKLGTHLYYALKKTAGYKVKSVIRNSLSKVNVRDLKNADIIFICTQDSKIIEAVKKLNRISPRLFGKIFYHTSGAQGSGLLNSLKKKGALTGSFHPVQTFELIAKRDTNRFNKIFIALEGDRDAVREGSNIVRRLGANPLILTKEQKVLHHINCVISSNFLVGMLSKIEEISDSMKNKSSVRKHVKSRLGFFQIYKPLITQTLNNIEQKGLKDSLTGPIERNDLDTIKLHLETLRKKFPGMLPFYILLSFETAKLGVKKKSLTRQDEKALQDLMKKYLKTIN